MSLLLAAGGSAPPAPIEPNLWLAEENWQPEDEYVASFGEVVNLIEDAVAVADDPEARIALYDEQPDLVVDEEYVQDQYTEPIGGPETYITPEPDPLLEEEYDAAAIANSQEDSLEGIFTPTLGEDHGFEHPDGEIPASVEDVAAPADDPETRPALDGSYDDVPDAQEDGVPQLVEDVAAPADDPETRPALDGSYDDVPDTQEDSVPQLVDDSLEGIFTPAPDEDHGFEHVDGEIPTSVEDVAAPADDPETRPALDGSYDDVPDAQEDGVPQIVDAEEQVRRSRRPSIRPVRDGYGTTLGAEGAGEVGTPHARTTVPTTIAQAGEAFAAGAHSHGEVGLIGASASGHAIPGNLRQVRGSLGIPIGFGAGTGTVLGVEATGLIQGVFPAGEGAASIVGVEATGEAGTPAGGGILNPTDEEIVALITAVRKRRKKQLTGR